MLRAVFANPENGETVVETNLPETPGETRFETYCEFVFRSEYILNYVTKQIKQDKEYRPRYVQLCCQAVASFLGVDESLVKQLEVGDNNIYREAVDTKSGSPEMTMFGIYFWYNAVFDQFKGKLRSKEDCTFEYDGKQFTIPVMRRDAISGNPINPSMTVQQALEILQYETAFNEIQAATEDDLSVNGKKVRKDLAEAQQFYITTLKKIALLVTPVEEIPTGEAEYQKWLNDQVVYWKDVDTETALDIVFFSVPTI